MKSKPLTAMLTVTVALATPIALSACGGSSGSSSSSQPAASSPATTTTTTTTTTTSGRKHKSKPAY